MKEFKASLLRERFAIHSPQKTGKDIVALSNRLAVPLQSTKIKEKLIVRAHNMHSCVRMGGRILHTFEREGSLIGRSPPYNWENAWKNLVSDYEQTYNPDRWIAVYHEGKPVFESGARHPFVDLIEKCDADNTSDYEFSIPMAEEAFRKSGKELKVDYEANVALAVHLEETQGRCSIILRGPDGTRTFSFTASQAGERAFNHTQCLTAAAGFLEGIQMAFMVGMNEEKIRIGKIERHSPEEKQTLAATKRLRQLAIEIRSLEESANVRYRPEKPELFDILADAREVAKTMFAPKAPLPETE